MASNEWLLFTAQLPATPSSLRVSVWRKLKEIGAVNMQNGVWVLPRNELTERYMERLLGYIRSNDASCQIFAAHHLETSGQEEILSHFNEDRNQEYQEFLEQSSVFVAEIEKETASNKFTFAELEENEQNLKRLKNWLQKIQSRDHFAASMRREAQTSLLHCVEKLHDYARRVYESEGVGLTGEDASLLDAALLMNSQEELDFPE